MADWPNAQLSALASEAEVEIETTTEHGESRRTTIWAVVDGGDVFIRSLRGLRGRWYRQLMVCPAATLWFDGDSIPVRAFPASDAQSIRRCSAALERKYAGDPSTASVLRPETLATTLRLVPTELREPTREGRGR